MQQRGLAGSHLPARSRRRLRAAALQEELPLESTNNYSRGQDMRKLDTGAGSPQHKAGVTGTAAPRTLRPLSACAGLIWRLRRLWVAANSACAEVQDLRLPQAPLPPGSVAQLVRGFKQQMQARG